MENAQFIAGIKAIVTVETNDINRHLRTQGTFKILAIGMCVFSCEWYVKKAHATMRPQIR